MSEEDEADRRGASYLLRGGSSLLHLAGVSIRDAEAVRLEIENRFGELRDARFEMVVQSPEHCFSTGWHSFEGADKVLRLGLSLPAVLSDVVDLHLIIEDDERADHVPAGIALRQIEIIAGRRTAPNAGARGMRVYPEAWGASAVEPSEPHFAALKALNYQDAEKFALFEVAIEGLTFGGRIDSLTKFKISKAKGALSIEFRQGPNWPRMFKAWPGQEQDRFGEVFRIRHTGDGLAIAGTVTADPDRDLLAALSGLMPAIVAAGVQTFPAARTHIPAWIEAARAFSAAGQDAFGARRA